MPNCNILPSSCRKREGKDNGKLKENGRGNAHHDLSGQSRAGGGQARRSSLRDLAGGADTAGAGSLSQGEERRCAMRGDGFVFQKPGTKFWWCGYSFRGKQFQESSKSTDKKVAERLLRRRLKEIAAKQSDFIDPAREQRWVLDDMLGVIQSEYERKQNRSFEDVRG